MKLPPIPRLLVLAAGGLLLASCGSDNPKQEEVVEWPELKALDIPSAKSEGMAKKKQLGELKNYLPEVAEIAAKITESTLPKNAKNIEAAKVLLDDLADLTKQAKSADGLADDELLDVGAAFHPLVAQLMRETGMPHLHEGEGPNGGYLHPLNAGDKAIGQIEIKLHDDAGDLEVWFTSGQTGDTPLDLPLDTVIEIAFPEMEGKSVELRVRNEVKNEGEDGASNIRDGRTNYFIFPGETGADAAWLMGKDFAAKIEVTFLAAGTDYSAAFELKPHVH